MNSPWRFLSCNYAASHVEMKSFSVTDSDKSGLTLASNCSVDTFAGPEFSLIVLLPMEKNGLEQLEAWLNAFTAMTCFGLLRARKRVRVSLPPFRVKQVTDMIPVLGALGVKRVFTEDAELWGSTAGDKRVTLLRHVVAFETARSAGRQQPRTRNRGRYLSALLSGLCTLVKLPRQTKQFTVDRPFVFFVTCASPRARPRAIILLGSVREIS
ncbi:hypothetical protein MRX96_007646 [Rhipicephalus microplus]